MIEEIRIDVLEIRVIVLRFVDGPQALVDLSAHIAAPHLLDGDGCLRLVHSLQQVLELANGYRRLGGEEEVQQGPEFTDDLWPDFLVVLEPFLLPVSILDDHRPDLMVEIPLCELKLVIVIEQRGANSHHAILLRLILPNKLNDPLQLLDLLHGLVVDILLLPDEAALVLL